jgi:glycosyltransferase involved in cell wall biosynthesis
MRVGGPDYDPGVPTKLPVTVVVPVRNEAAALPACLGRLTRFERVVVVDSASTDGTPGLARQAGAEVLEFRWDGRFPKKRNWFLRNHAPATPWVLFLDADELVDDAFCDELAATLPGTRHAGFWITYDNWFLGKRLRHGTPNRKLALIRTGAGEYERIDEDRWSQLDMEIHEHPVLSGTCGTIGARVEHRDDRGLEHWLRRHVDYAAWEVRRARALEASGGAGHLTPRQRAKYRHLGSWWLPPAVFATNYLLKLGFLDGHRGFAHAVLKSWYFWVIGCGVREERRRSG